MKPEGIVGTTCWNSLNEGSVVTGVDNNHEFVVRRKSGRFSNLVTSVADSVSRVLPRGKKERIVTEILERVAIQYPVRERLDLRMAAAGIIQYKTDSEGRLYTDVIIPVTKQNFIDFCEDFDSASVRKDLGKIETDLNRLGFRELFCDLILQEDIARCRSEKTSPDETSIKKVEGYLGEGITTTLVNHSRSIDTEQMLQSLRKSKPYSLATERGVRNLNLLMLRLFMVRVGLIPAVEMEYAWQHFINEINSFKMWDFRESLWGGAYGMGDNSSDKLQNLINKCINHRAEMPTSATVATVRTKVIKDLIYHDMSSIKASFTVRTPGQIESYKPEMERAGRAPGLPNQGNLCYYNSVIKMLANQFSMEHLEISRKGESVNAQTGDTEAAEKQKLKEKLINLLKAIKYCRSGLCESGWAGKKSTEFLQQFQLCCQQGIFNKEFSDNRQNDAHELFQVLNEILGYSENPKYSFRENSQLTVRIDERFLGTRCIEGNFGEMIISPNLKINECASYTQCLDDFLQEEVINYCWWNNCSPEEYGLDQDALIENNISHRAAYQRELENHKDSIATSSEYTSNKDYLKSVKSMKLKKDGYFERQTAKGGIEHSEIPPWIKLTKKISLVVDPEKLQSLMLLPRIFSYTNQGGYKLHNQGMAFFQSCLDGVDIPVIDLAGNSLNIKTEVIGFCGHKGNIKSGHYVYFEKNESGMWVLNNDQSVNLLGNDGDLQKYLVDKIMTPYFYHLKLLEDHNSTTTG